MSNFAFKYLDAVEKQFPELTATWSPDFNSAPMEAPRSLIVVRKAGSAKITEIEFLDGLREEAADNDIAFVISSIEHALSR
jgi:hypothetical protein